MKKILEKPDWLKKRISKISEIEKTVNLLKKLSLHTVCESAACPNMGECFGNKTATFMILGNECTRQCRFCAVSKGTPGAINLDEPANIGKASAEMGLKHIVVTSVTRDDISDGGASHFAKTVFEIRKYIPLSTVELLIPDLRGDHKALKIIVDSKPDILNHNIETVPSLYETVRPQADYTRSLKLLYQVKEFDDTIYTKSGMMVGLGETDKEISKVMDDLRQVNCDILTIGQYLPPSKQHIEIKEYVHPDKFLKYQEIAEEKGFLFVASGPFVRSSYHAAIGINRIKNMTR